jgi:hypothetical protein
MPLPEGVSPSAVIRHVEAQAKADLGRKLIQGGAPPSLASDLARIAWEKANRLVRRRSAPHERAYAMRAGGLIDKLGPADMAALRAATLKGGTDGAKEEIKSRLLVKKVQPR